MLESTEDLNWAMEIKNDHQKEGIDKILQLMGYNKESPQM